MLPDFMPAAESPFYAANRVGLADFTIGTAGGGAITVTVQLKNNKGNNGFTRSRVACYLASTSNGDTITPSAATLAVSSLGGPIMITVTGKAFNIVSNAAGKFDVLITATGVTYYLVVCMPDGSLVISNAIVLP